MPFNLPRGWTSSSTNGNSNVTNRKDSRPRSTVPHQLRTVQDAGSFDAANVASDGHLVFNSGRVDQSNYPASGQQPENFSHGTADAWGTQSNTPSSSYTPSGYVTPLRTLTPTDFDIPWHNPDPLRSPSDQFCSPHTTYNTTNGGYFTDDESARKAPSSSASCKITYHTNFHQPPPNVSGSTTYNSYTTSLPHQAPQSTPFLHYQDGNTPQSQSTQQVPTWIAQPPTGYQNQCILVPHVVYQPPSPTSPAQVTATFRWEVQKSKGVDQLWNSQQR